MEVFRNFAELRNFLDVRVQKGQTIGFVPTMGALHPGHISLIEESKKACDITVCSVFVNPTQFNNPNDLLHYPRTLEEDLRQLEKAECDVAFVPAVEEVYPAGFHSLPIDLAGLDQPMEGKHRPGHFDGVVQVVWRFFEQIRPDRAFFGQKDFQQLAVVRQLVRIKKASIEIVGCPILRENSGLAMSSRNLRLSSEGRDRAAFVFEKLDFAREMYPSMSVTEICGQIQETFLARPEFSLEYFEIVNSDTLQPVKHRDEPARAFIAVHLEGIRLIDNCPLN